MITHGVSYEVLIPIFAPEEVLVNKIKPLTEDLRSNFNPSTSLLDLWKIIEDELALQNCALEKYPKIHSHFVAGKIQDLNKEIRRELTVLPELPSSTITKDNDPLFSSFIRVKPKA